MSQEEIFKRKETVLSGARIFLKLLKEDNATEEYCSWLSDPVVNKYLETRTSTIQELKNYINQRIDKIDNYFFGIFLKENNQHIGNIKLEPIDYNRKISNFGILIGNKDYWGQGYGTEATELILDFAFNQLSLQIVELGVIAENKSAIKVYEKVGFKLDKIENNSINHDGKPYNCYKMSISKDYKEKKEDSYEENREERKEKMRRCTKCVMPETWESINFDEKGVCNICKNIKIKKELVDWDKKKQEFIELANEHKGKGQYDCIIPFSGGKDSTFTLYTVVKEFGLKPLVISFDHGFYRPRILNNREKILKKLGVDFISFKPNWKVVKKTMLESLKRKGDFCWHCHTGIFAYPMQIAVKFKIPLIIWGEPSAEYGGYYTYGEENEEVDEKRFNMFVNLGITAEDMVGMLDESVTLKDIEPFRYPSIKDLRELKCKSVCLGSFIPWDPRKNAEIITKELGWEGEEVEGVPSNYYYEKVECKLQGIRDYIKFIKRGLGRTAHLTSIDVRNNLMDRDTALRLTKEFDGKRPASLDYFLEIMNISEEEFMEIALSHVVSPHVHNPEGTIPGKRLWDQDLWNK